MWLLHTSTGAFRSFDDPGDVAYAAVSYVWAQDQPSYQDLLDIQATSSTVVPETTFLSDPRLSPTIRYACKIAADAGHHFVWLSSCGINGTDSAELADAPNNMWQWYACASVCFAYLDDVTPGNSARSTGSQFRKSGWHMDVWTLQALIASKNLVFLAKDWSVVGTKTTLASTIEEVCGVDRAVIRGDATVRDVSIARRMWWASKRRASRMGDTAYALMGLFGVRMTTAWGEGPQAFRHLQEEIVRTIPDQSIFAWHYHLGHEHPDGLFAFGPCCFARSGGITPIPLDDLAARLGLSEELDSCLPGPLSSSALTLRTPLIPHYIETYPPTTAFYEVFGVAARFSHAAILQCVDGQGRLLILTLNQRSDAHPRSKVHVVKAVETTLGQRDRVWSCPQLLAPYREAVVVSDVDILRGPLQVPWVQPVPSRAPLVPTARTPQTSVVLDPACRAALAEQGCGVAYETRSQERVDDLYERTHRARLFVDVHRFVLSLQTQSTGEGTPRAGRISVELTMRRHSLAPIPGERIDVRWEDRTGEHEAVRLGVANTLPAGVRYAVGSHLGAPQVLSLNVSRLPDADAVHLLRIELEGLDDRPEISLVYQRTTDEAKTARISQRSSTLPRLPSICGWASRRGGSGSVGK